MTDLALGKGATVTGDPGHEKGDLIETNHSRGKRDLTGIERQGDHDLLDPGDTGIGVITGDEGANLAGFSFLYTFLICSLYYGSKVFDMGPT